MYVLPELVEHPKYLLLRRRIGDRALEYLLRIWGHCQVNQRGGGWKGVNSEYIEIIAKWDGEKNVLYDALEEYGWIHTKKWGVEIHEWNIYNARLLQRWNNGAKAKGKRKTVSASAKGKRKTPGAKAKGGRKSSFGQAIRGEGIGLDRIGEDKSSPPSPPHEGDPEEVPEGLRTSEFVATWRKWMSYRRAFRKPKDWRVMFAEQLAWLAGFPVETAIEIMRQSMRNGWQGLQEPKGRAAQAQVKPGSPGQPGSAAERMALRDQIKLLEERINAHPANRESSSHNPSCLAEEREEFKSLRRQLAELKERLR